MHIGFSIRDIYKPGPLLVRARQSKCLRTIVCIVALKALELLIQALRDPTKRDQFILVTGLTISYLIRIHFRTAAYLGLHIP